MRQDQRTAGCAFIIAASRANAGDTIPFIGEAAGTEGGEQRGRHGCFKVLLNFRCFQTTEFRDGLCLVGLRIVRHLVPPELFATKGDKQQFGLTQLDHIKRL